MTTKCYYLRLGMRTQARNVTCFGKASGSNYAET